MSGWIQAAMQHNTIVKLGKAGCFCDRNSGPFSAWLKNSKKKSSTFDGNATAMVITDASSYASSYDDDDFDRAMAVAEGEMGII